MTYKNANKRDTVEHEILAFWKKAGCVWISMKPDAGFDGLLLHHGHLHLVEIKSGKRWKLTEHELKTMELALTQGVDYRIIDSVEAAQKLLEGELT